MEVLAFLARDGSLKQAAIFARQLQMKIYSNFWRDFGGQRSTDFSLSRNLLTVKFPFLNLRWTVLHSSVPELEKKAVWVIAQNV